MFTFHLFYIFLTIVFVWGEVDTDFYTDSMVAYTECAKELGLTFDYELIYDPNAKCLHACVLEKAGAIVNNKLSLDYVLGEKKEVSTSRWSQKLTKCVNFANEVDDKCKTAVSFYQCIGLLPQN